MTHFNTAYMGAPPWDIGRPQREFVDLEQAGEIQGSVLDLGCGTGENALYLATRGHTVWGIDSAPLAIEKARAKAKERGLDVNFREFDALSLFQLGKTFDTVIDSGLFHTFDDDERPLYADSVSSVLKTDGRLFILSFSEHEPPGWGPRRVTQAELRATFGRGWVIEWIRPGSFETTLREEEVRAWLTAVRKVSAEPPKVW